MFDPKQLLDQVLGGGAAGGMRSAGTQVKNRLDSLGGTGGFATGAAVGGLLGRLIGNKSVRKATGGMRLFSQVERLGLDAEAKAFVFDLLTKPVDLEGIAASVATPEQGAELYLASRLAIDPDEPAERAYLDALAARLRLPAQLRSNLDQQVRA